MKSKFYNGPVNGLKTGICAASSVDASGDRPVSIMDSRKELLDSAVITRLIDIMKTSSNLQRKAASILEFMTVIEPSMETIIKEDIWSGLEAVFQQNALKDMEADVEDQEPDKYALQLEEAAQSVCAASRLLTKLLDSEQFSRKIDTTLFTKLLREILKSAIPLQTKDWVAACLVKLSSLSGPYVDYENPINIEVTLYEAIPRLIEQIQSSFSPETQEAAAVEPNRIISEGFFDSTRAVASGGGIFPLVKLVEKGSDRAVEAALLILYNLSMYNENHSAIIAAEAVPVLSKIVLSQRSYWTRALRLLRNLPV